ncbi:hypothetical protein AB0R12_31605, partial [Streptomyces niveus]
CRRPESPAGRRRPSWSWKAPSSAHGDSMELEEFLGERLGLPVPGGHRFGDELGALRVRLDTGPLLGSTPELRTESLTAADPLELPQVAEALDTLRAALRELR